ncbi:MAG: hypothetical protein HQL95_12860 [Magnetococcales bacterium]|nr:hypothetical protein [Magnetococcales bacterium]
MAHPADDTPRAASEEQPESRSDTGRGASGDPVCPRRRLLKSLVTAGAGVPVLLTLSSGAALAATSNKNCIDTTLTYDENGFRCIAPATEDRYVRVKRGTITGATNVTLNSNPAGTLGDDISGGTSTVNDMCLVYHTPSGTNTGSPVYGNGTNNYGRNGTNVRLTQSCWSSFAK